VCPWNLKFSSPDALPLFTARTWNVNPDPAGMLSLNDEELTTQYENSSIKWTQLCGLHRNAAVAMAHREAGTEY
jgi:epoxyqueuosine reductase QueG